MNKKIATLAVAGIKINVELLFEETGPRFGPFLTDYDAEAAVVGLTTDEINEAKPKYPPEICDSIIEYNELMFKVSDLLLNIGIATFHGTAFIWHEKAWIFAAPSGTGKTTQYVLWKWQFGDEIRLLNGDKTFLKCEDDGQITVYPSPWAGKEVMSRMESASLGGIILLEQAKENSIVRITPKDAAKPLFSQFIFERKDKTDIDVLKNVLGKMLDVAELWYFKNTGDVLSAHIAHDTIEKANA